jgi:anti-sigma-K factor RskA
MDLKEYIASGVVEMYSLGTLTESEKVEFEQRLLMYPDLIRELNQVQLALSAYAKVHAINPRPGLRVEVMQDTLNVSGNKSLRSKNNTADKNHSITYKYLIAASLAALAISTFASWFFYSRWEDSEERFSQLLKEKNQLAQNYNLVKDGFDKTVYDMLIMRNERSQLINLLPADTSINYLARLYWNHDSKEIYIDVLKLPEPIQDHEYQLWAILNGQAYNAGLFDAHEFSGIQRMQDIPAADSWLVTLEPKGGSPIPTLEHSVLFSESK